MRQIVVELGGLWHGFFLGGCCGGGADRRLRRSCSEWLRARRCGDRVFHYGRPNLSISFVEVRSTSANSCRPLFPMRAPSGPRLRSPERLGSALFRLCELTRTKAAMLVSTRPARKEEGACSAPFPIPRNATRHFFCCIAARSSSENPPAAASRSGSDALA